MNSQTMFEKACENGDLEKAKELLKNNPKLIFLLNMNTLFAGLVKTDI